MNETLPVDPNCLSTCHKAKCLLVSSEEQTSFYTCGECKQPCDIEKK